MAETKRHNKWTEKRLKELKEFKQRPEECPNEEVRHIIWCASRLRHALSFDLQMWASSVQTIYPTLENITGEYLFAISPAQYPDCERYMAVDLVILLAQCYVLLRAKAYREGYEEVKEHEKKCVSLNTCRKLSKFLFGDTEHTFTIDIALNIFTGEPTEFIRRKRSLDD